MRVFTFVDSTCGKKIITENMGDILEWIKDALECMIPSSENKSVFTITVSEMTREALDAVPEFQGC